MPPGGQKTEMPLMGNGEPVKPAAPLDHVVIQTWFPQPSGGNGFLGGKY